MPHTSPRTAPASTWPKRSVLHEIKPLLISPATVLFGPVDSTLEKGVPSTAPAYFPPKTSFNHTVHEPIKSVMKLHTKQWQDEWNFSSIPNSPLKKEQVSKKSSKRHPVAQDTPAMPNIQRPPPTRSRKKPATTETLNHVITVHQVSPFIPIPYGKPLTPERFDYYQWQNSLNATQTALLPHITPKQNYHDRLAQVSSHLLKLPNVAVLPRSPNVFPNRHATEHVLVDIDKELLSKNLESAVARTESKKEEGETLGVDDLDLKLQICELVRNSHTIDHDISEILDLHSKKDHRIKSINTKKEIRLQKELRQKIMAAIAKNHVRPGK